MYNSTSIIHRESLKMGVFYHEEEEPPIPSKPCTCLSSALKEVFSHCSTFNRQLSGSYLEDDDDDDDNPTSDFEEEVVSEIRMRAMEKLRKKPSFTMETFSCIFSPHMGVQHKDGGGGGGDDEEAKEEFMSVRSCFTCCSSAATMEAALLSARSNFSRASSLGEFEFQFLQRRSSVMEEFCHCEGWPFGLCKKLLLLPPLPKSPTESWLWRRDKRVKRTPFI